MTDPFKMGLGTAREPRFLLRWKYSRMAELFASVSSMMAWKDFIGTVTRKEVARDRDEMTDGSDYKKNITSIE